MARYITPSKIGLLALISMYAEDVVPSASTIPVLSFVLSHVLPWSPGGTFDRKSALDIADFEKVTAPHASSRPGRTIWDLLLRKLWEVESFDALHVFFESLKALLIPTREGTAQAELDGFELESSPIQLSRASPLGGFVRRASLEFTRMQLDDSVALWKGFVVYRSPTFAAWKRRNLAASRAGFDSQLRHSTNRKIKEILYGDATNVILRDASASADDMESLLEFQIDKMQSLCPSKVGRRSR